MDFDTLEIDHAIIHIADTNLDSPFTSSVELEKDSAVWGYLEAHLVKVMRNDALKDAYLSDDLHKANLLMKSITPDNLSEITAELTTILFGMMKTYALASSDIIYAIVKINKAQTYLAMMKFNYKETFTHSIEGSKDSVSIGLLKQKTTLPTESQKLDECIVVNLETFELKILEKAVEIDGGKDYYLSNTFLKCKNDLSTKEKVSILYKSVDKVSSACQEKDFRRSALLFKTIAESVDETNEIKIGNVAAGVFADDPTLQTDFIREIKTAGLTEDVISVPEDSQTVKKAKRNKIKTDTGIEIHFPSHYYNDKNIIDFMTNPDGTVSILIKNVSIK